MTEEDKRIRADFPIFENDNTIYIDTAATSQKPLSVLDAVRDYYENANANPLRGLYDLSMRATECYETARSTVAEFVNAPAAENIVFTRNASESLNLVAYSYGMNSLKEGDEVLVSIMEHHSNLLPWQLVCRATGAVLKFVECDKEGHLTPEMVEAAVNDRTKLLAVTYVSNVFGCRNDIKSFAEIIHNKGGIIVCDGAQALPHIPVDVQELNVDFLAFSGHKMLAPMGIGGLYGRQSLLEEMPPFMYGGEMIEIVTRESATYAEVPHKFEAGTVNAGGAVGLKAAIEYMNGIGFETIERRENALSKLCMELMAEDEHIHVIGDKDYVNHHGIVTFTLDDVHPHDIAAILNDENIAIRAGHHCAQPLLKYLGTNSTARASFGFYNTEDEVRQLVAAVRRIRGKMGY
ncbi:MAG: SufS family cysteine desulfurase [Lachnospiraceae bacterium]|nr:SufS family cysteine desulfurase [Lachnospiraceae bacterium]